jgi:hypothetical protein
MAFLKVIKVAVPSWAPFLRAFTNGLDEEMACVSAIQAFVFSDEPSAATIARPVFGLILQAFWEEDVVSDVAISEWAGEVQEDEEEADEGSVEGEEPEAEDDVEEVFQKSGANASTGIAVSALDDEPRKRKVELLAQKWTQRLLESFDVEDEDEEEDEN